MPSILEEFALGNISPEIQTFKPNSKYGQALRAACDNETKLSSKLNDEEKIIWQKFVDAQCELNRLTAIQNFIYGYKLRLLMTAEAFITGDQIIAGEEYK